MKGLKGLKSKLKTALKITAAIAAAVILAAVIIKLFPLVLSLRDAQSRARFAEFIDSVGIFGVIIMFLLQALQIAVAFIPGEPIEILMGMMYGTFGGLALSLAGVAAGQSLVFFLVKKYGVGFARRFVDVEKFKSLKFLKDPAKRDGLIFLLFFIPGTPKDILVYFAPFTDIGFLRFLVIATFSRIPSVITSTWAGATLSEGSFLKTVIIFAVTGLIGIGGIFINKRLTKNSTDTEPHS